MPKPQLVYDANHVGPVMNPHQQATDSASSRMLAAIVPHGSDAWFFKVMGSDQAVAGIKDSFVALIQSVRFSQPDGGVPTWTLPDMWRQQAGSGLRHATIEIASAGGQLELTVTTLRVGGELSEYILSNVNRWRHQLQLQPISQDQLEREATRVDLQGTQATIVDLGSSN